MEKEDIIYSIRQRRESLNYLTRREKEAWDTLNWVKKRKEQIKDEIYDLATLMPKIENENDNKNVCRT